MRLLIEGLTPNLTDYVEEFIDFMCGTIGVEERPEVSFVSRTGNASFGHYQPSTGAIVVATEGRHIADTLRTLGHEIVHHKQMEAGEIDTLPLLDLERDANAVVGLAMRDYNKLHPELYGVEEPLPDNQLDQEGESQGSTFPDATRPSGPINMAEAKIRETDSDTLKLLKLQNQALRAFASSPRQREIQKQIEVLRKNMKTQGTPEYHTTLKEDGIVNAAGSGAIAGIGIGPQGEPGVPKKKTLKVFRRSLVKEYFDKARTTNDADAKKRLAQARTVFGKARKK